MVLLGLNIAKVYADREYLYYWEQFIEVFGLYFLLWGQSIVAKKEQFILMIYQ